jgi:hypothetical protein
VIGSVASPDALDKGSIKRSVPISITERNPAISTVNGLNFLLFFSILKAFNLLPHVNDVRILYHRRNTLSRKKKAVEPNAFAFGSTANV